MPLATKTYEQIRDEYLSDIRAEITDAKTQKGSDYQARGSALASALLPIYANGSQLENEALPTKASEKGLERFAQKYRVPRRGATFAAGSVTVTSSFATTIAAGTTLINPSTGSRYATVGLTTVGATLSATANVIALEKGASSNALAGVSLTFESAPPGLNPKVTVVSISGGDNQWSVRRWGQEIVKRMNAKPAAGNWAHIAALADTVAGVEQAFVYGALRGTGTLDVVITTSATTGTRVASADLLSRVLGAFISGAQEDGGDFIAPLSGDLIANTRLHAATEQGSKVKIGYKATTQNPFASWPPSGSGYLDVDNENTFYKVTSQTSASSFTIGTPAAGTIVQPAVGNEIGAQFPSVGFAKGRILSINGTGPWILTVSWSPTPTETTITVGTVLSPWCSQLPLIAGPPTDATGDGLSGAVPEYFAKLGPGEMTPLTVDDLSRRRRWPFIGDISPFDGQALFPSDVTARLSISSTTDARDFSVTADIKAPSVPDASFIGTPPSILTINAITVIPVT